MSTLNMLGTSNLSFFIKTSSLGAESRKKSYAKHFGYKLATGLHLKKNEF